MRNKIPFYFLFISTFILCSLSAEAQRKNKSYIKYIDQYNYIAIKHQNKYGIPASITLAQGILESGAGLSELARKSNNHFGIKCHNDWKGGRTYHDDDYRGECFRKYKRVEDSYEDHALFLTQRPRYAHLFSLNRKDYKGWARGLQKSGYATDKAYANKLIKMIEDYELYKFDSQVNAKRTNSTSSSRPVLIRDIFKTHGLIYIYARENDSFEDIAYDLGFKPKDLQKYNEVPTDFPLQKGDIIYLQKKKKKADKPYYDHVIQVGESMHSISQKYGIRLKSLYKMNKKKGDYIPEEGDVLKLR
ncbi:MAG: glucosaminidase domain-containing protein [Massilibacteroides sp.]|nr:glucosaminidase domain-containing protein [Massilibacteroides sp.]MDD3061548.1 glucosaminidase domain-containing protein [Massilibacteroides sp.]MDD4115391.1 glucosaminidase domain-containing protein [Massilibacteroides sp.]MDD4659162.1 glucosaminidase domain-containing protein [Massilibacteroides sp.]